MHKLRVNIRRLRHSSTIVLECLLLHLLTLGRQAFIKCSTTRSHLWPLVSPGGAGMVILGSTLTQTALLVSDVENFLSSAPSRSHETWSTVTFIGMLYVRSLRDFKLSSSLLLNFFNFYFVHLDQHPRFSSHHIIRSL
jgi:hypothetical protein